MRWRCSRRRASSGTDAVGDGDQALAGHQLVDLLARVGGEADVAVGDDADQAVGVALDHRDAADAVGGHQRGDVGERLVGVDGERVHHHAGLEFLDAADLGGLLGGFQVLVDDAEAALLGHGDGHGGLGDGVHRRRDDRDVERDGAGEAGAGVGGGGQDLGVAGDQQHVVEGERLVDARGCEAPGSCPGVWWLGVGGVECHGREGLSATLAAPHRRVGGSSQARGCDWLGPTGRACRADRGGVERGWSRCESTRPAMMLERLRSHQRLVRRCQGTRLSSVAIAPGYQVEAGRRGTG